MRTLQIITDAVLAVLNTAVIVALIWRWKK